MQEVIEPPSVSQGSSAEPVLQSPVTKGAGSGGSIAGAPQRGSQQHVPAKEDGAGEPPAAAFEPIGRGEATPNKTRAVAPKRGRGARVFPALLPMPRSSRLAC